MFVLSSTVVSFLLLYFKKLSPFLPASQDPQRTARQICNLSVERSIKQKKTSDNVTVMIITLTRGIPNLEKTLLK